MRCVAGLSAVLGHSRGTKDHINMRNMRISHSGSKPQYKILGYQKSCLCGLLGTCIGRLHLAACVLGRAYLNISLYIHLQADMVSVYANRFRCKIQTDKHVDENARSSIPA